MNFFELYVIVHLMDNKTETVTIRMTAEQLARLKVVADQDGRSKADMLRRLIDLEYERILSAGWPFAKVPARE